MVCPPSSSRIFCTDGGVSCAFVTSFAAAKYGMSLTVLGIAEEYKGRVAVNALWPRTGIATAAVKMLAGSAGVSACRTPEIMADSAHWILSQVRRVCSTVWAVLWSVVCCVCCVVCCVFVVQGCWNVRVCCVLTYVVQEAWHTRRSCCVLRL